MPETGGKRPLTASGMLEVFKKLWIGELGAAVAAAGFNNVEIAEGVTLNVACRVTTKPCPDGKYTNIDKVLPANGQQPLRRGWS